MIYVLHVKTGKEMIIRDKLRSIYFHGMVPRELCIERRDGETERHERAIFPGYVFVDMILTLSGYHKIKAIPNVYKFLGGGEPAILSVNEAEHIMWLTNCDKPLPPSELNQDGKVTGGPLAGHEDKIVSLNKRQCRAKVKVEIMGEPHDISLSVTMPADSQQARDELCTSKTGSKRRG